MSAPLPRAKFNSGNDRGLGRRPKIEGLDSSRIRLYAKRRRPIVQPHTEISHRSSNLFSATEVAETIGTDLETINEWLEVGAIDRAVFGGGRFSKSNYKERHSHSKW